VANNESDTVSHELSGGGNRLLRITEVVDHNQVYLLAKYAARSIDVRDGHFRGALLLFAGPGELSAKRIRKPDQHVCASGKSKRDD
jgi:hypothetical protein